MDSPNTDPYDAWEADQHIDNLVEELAVANVTFLQHGRRPEFKPDILDFPELLDVDLAHCELYTQALIAGIAQCQ